MLNVTQRTSLILEEVHRPNTSSLIVRTSLLLTCLQLICSNQWVSIQIINKNFNLLHCELYFFLKMTNYRTKKKKKFFKFISSFKILATDYIILSIYLNINKAGSKIFQFKYSFAKLFYFFFALCLKIF